MKWQFFLQFLEFQPSVKVVVYFLLAVTHFHQVSKMEGDVPETRLIVFVKYFLNPLHVLKG